MIDKATIDRIYAAANIVEIVGEFVQLRKKGANYQACCPFHNEKTPSFVVSPAKGLFKCFGCGKGGNAVTFLMEQENMTYPEALKYVAKKYGIEVQERQLTPEEERRNDDRESMMVLNSYAADYFRRYLHRENEGISVGMSYFRQRGFTDATIEKFQLGFCPSAGDRFTRDALAEGYKEQFLTGTGLTIVREHGGYYDRFAGRVMFPIHTISGRVIAFGGRTLRTDKQVAKYQNSPESELYSKRNNLYGLFFAKKAIAQEGHCILVEGYTDVISMHQSGVENVVASSGTSLTVEQIRLISRFTNNITVIYDGDSAGIKASLRGIDMILREGMNVRVVLLPEPEDPDSFARSHTSAEVKEYIRANEVDFITFKARILRQDAGDDPIRKAELILDMVGSLSEIPDPIVRSVYIKECSRTLDVNENLLIDEVAKRRLSYHSDTQTREFIRRQQQERQQERTAAAPPSLPEGRVTAGSGIAELEKELIKYLLKYGHKDFDYKEGRNLVQLNVAEIIIGDLQANGITFHDPRYRAIYDCYVEQFNRLGIGTEVPVHLFINHSDAAVCNTAVDLLTADDNYVPSSMWKKHDIAVESEQERLAEAVPRAVILYKSKAIEEITARLSSRLEEEGLSDEELEELTFRIAALNKERMAISKKLSRLIL